MTMLLGVLGNPVGHSRSPEIHDLFSKSASLEVDYRRILVPPGEFSKTAQAFLSQGAAGFNITVPNKYDAYLLADELTQSAGSAQAVNTIQVMKDGSLKGHNTDGPGLVADIKNSPGWSVANQRILVIGAGGAVQGVLDSLLAEGPARLDLCNRTHQKAEALVNRIEDDRLVARPIDQLGESYDLVISGSSAGLDQNSATIDLPDCIVDQNSKCYDMIYARELTPFLLWCKQRGARRLLDGLGMLVRQAALAFEIWTGTKVETHSVINSLRNTL